MPLTTSGAISISDVATEFGGSTPHSLSDYYAAADGVPGSGAISMSDFYGKSAIPPPLFEYPGAVQTYRHYGHSYPNYLASGAVSHSSSWRSLCTGNVSSNLITNMLSGDVLKCWSEDGLSEVTVEVEYSFKVNAEASGNSTFSVDLPSASHYPVSPRTGINSWPPPYATGADPGQTACQLITWNSNQIKKINEQGQMEYVGSYSGADFRAPRTISGKTYVTLLTYNQYDYQFGFSTRLNSRTNEFYGNDVTLLSMKVSRTTDARAIEVGNAVMRRELVRSGVEEAAEKLALAAAENAEDKE